LESKQRTIRFWCFSGFRNF